MSYVLGIDLGTSSMLGILLNNKGEIVYQTSSSYPLYSDRSGYSEQDPATWIKACHHILSKMMKEVPDFSKELEGISFSGQMHSLVLLDKDQQVLRRSILWNDTRNSKECLMIENEYKNLIRKTTKNITLEGFTLPKILWLQNNENELYKNVAHILLPKDYLRFALTGNFHMDYSDAAGTLLMDTTLKQWSKDILDEFNIKESALPKLVNSFDHVGYVKPEYKNYYNFSKDVKVFAGGADNAVSSLGAGLIDSNTAIASVGTSGVFLSLEDSNHDNYDGRVHLFNHIFENKYYSMGVTLAAGQSLSWFKNLTNENTPYDEYLKDLDKTPVGSHGLLFTPYISGERTPHINGDIRGSFIGLSSNHTLEDMKRAIIEGITFSINESKVLMETLRERKFESIISIGGGSKNREWLQIQADIFDARIIPLKNQDAPALGAAMIAAIGLGWYESVGECVAQIVQYEEPVYPILENVKKYEVLFEHYRKVYGLTESLCLALKEV